MTPDPIDWNGASDEAGTRPGALAGVRVLVVDDNADLRQIIEIWFEYLGCAITTAESADEALFLFPRVRPDIVLADISMPHHDGCWLLRQLRTLERKGPHTTPVVAMTALGDIREVPHAVRAGFDDWVSKPFNLPDLGRLVERLTRRRAA